MNFSPKIALIVPLCSRKQNYQSLDDTTFIKSMIPSFEMNKSEGYEYQFYLGYDDDDIFYIDNHENLEKLGYKVFKLSGCQNAPAFAWNKLFEIAYNEGYDYFYQMGDDTIFQSKGWTEKFIEKLRENNDVGVVGPCDPINHLRRVQLGRRIILEISFVSRKHYEIQQTYFHPQIKNWFCDDWISETYRNNGFYIFPDITFTNANRYERYEISHCERFDEFVKEGVDNILKYLEPKNESSNKAKSESNEKQVDEEPSEIKKENE